MSSSKIPWSFQSNRRFSMHFRQNRLLKKSGCWNWLLKKIDCRNWLLKSRWSFLWIGTISEIVISSGYLPSCKHLLKRIAKKSAITGVFFNDRWVCVSRVREFLFCFDFVQQYQNFIRINFIEYNGIKMTFAIGFEHFVGFNNVCHSNTNYTEN